MLKFLTVVRCMQNEMHQVSVFYFKNNIEKCAIDCNKLKFFDDIAPSNNDNIGNISVKLALFQTLVRAENALLFGNH